MTQISLRPAFRPPFRSIFAAAAAWALAASALCARAEGLAPPAWFLAPGFGSHGTHSLTVGGIWPLSFQSSLLGTQVSAQAEGYVSAWNYRSLGGGRDTIGQIGLVPVLRFRLDEGRSPWFVDAGLGVSWTSDLYTADDKQFSTRFNFHDTVGLGYSFGANRSQEIGVRLVHFSNAGLKKPNPGKEFLQLRYAHSF